jgi:uncharacterized protein YqeY
MLKSRIDQDLKTALLAGDKVLVTTLRGLKSVILYAEVAKGAREVGLSDEEIVALFSKEAKKRQESADLYTQGGNAEKAAAELTEKQVIEAYLPSQLSDEELSTIIDDSIQEINASDLSQMGQVIALAKQKTAGRADGSRIAQAVKEKLQK